MRARLRFSMMGLLLCNNQETPRSVKKSWLDQKYKSGARAGRLAASARPHRAKGQSRARSRIYLGARAARALVQTRANKSGARARAKITH
jgi:hypothetical protein